MNKGETSAAGQLEEEDNLMARSGRIPPLRRRQQAANDRRFCMLWINRMVNKKVEKRIAELRSEMLLMNYALREEIMAELRELRAERGKARVRSVRYARLDEDQRVTSKLRRREDKYTENTREDEETEAKSMDLETRDLTLSETLSNAHRIIMRKPPKQRESSKVLLDVSSDGDISAEDTSDEDTSYGETDSQPFECEQQEDGRSVSADVAGVSDTRQLMRASEEAQISRNSNPGFVAQRGRREVRRGKVDRSKEEEALLMERQWSEWMDKREMRGNHVKEEPVDRQSADKQPGAPAPPVSEKQMKSDVRGAGRKLKTYLSDIFSPHSPYKWERLEEED